MNRRTFILTSSHFEGEVILEFGETGRIAHFDMRGAKLTVQQQDYILNGLPKEVSEVEKLLRNSRSAKLTEINRDITFDMFWDKYDEKIRSSKKKALARWNKLNKTNQINAYIFISRYEMHLMPGTAKKYAETYLNAELWNN